MMKSAIDWLMGKSSAVAENNEQLISALHLNADSDSHNYDRDSSKENSLLNGHFSDSMEPVSELQGRRRKPSGEEVRSPWGRTLTPKSPKFAIENGNKRPQMASSLRISSALPHKNKSPVSWEDISFASEVTSPGFVSRIAKEGRVKKQLYDGSRKYPIGQDKFICAGYLPNVRLKGKKKPVVLARRTPTSPLLPLASSASPFSSKITPGFLASASTRMPDISSVASVFDSVSPTSATESIKDPTSVHAVVAALEQAQSLKSGVKRSRYMEPEDSNKKQKCVNNVSQGSMSSYSTPVVNKNFSAGIGGEKRALDLSPPSNTECCSSEKAQLSPENKRRCIPDPRIASFSSSKIFASNKLNVSESGRESPFFMYESHHDSDSESNKSLDSHPSRRSEHSFQGQNIDLTSGGISNHEPFDRSGSQTPQSQRGSYCVSGLSNGSSSSSRTTTPSRPSHAFSLEAYKADKAKSQQRLNKMLGMLFNVSDEEVLASLEAQKLNSISSFSASQNLPNSTPLSSSTEPSVASIAQVSTSSTSLNVVQPTVEVVENSKGTNDISASYTFTIKSPASTVKNHVDKLPTVCEDSNPITLASILSKHDSTDASKGGETKAGSLSRRTSLTDLLSKGYTLPSNSVAAAFAIPQMEKLQKDTATIANQMNSNVNDSSKFNFMSSKSSSSLNVPCTEKNEDNSVPSKPQVPQHSFSFGNPEKIASNKSIGESSITSLSSTAVSSATSNLMPAMFSFGSANKEASKSEVTNESSQTGMSTGLFPNLTSNATTTPITLAAPISSSSTSSLFSFGGNNVGSSNSNNKLTERSKTNQQSVSSFSFGSKEQKNTLVSASNNTSSGISIFNYQPSSVASGNSTITAGPISTVNSSALLSSSSQPTFNFGQSFANSNDTGVTATTANIPTTSISGSMFSFGSAATTKPNDKPFVPSQGSPFTFGSSQPISSTSLPLVTNPTTTSSAPVFGSGGGGFSFAPKVVATTKSLPTPAAFSFGSSTCSSSTSSSGFSFNPISSSQPFNFSSTTKSASIPTATTSNSNIFTFGNSVSSKPATASSFAGFGDPAPASTTTSGFSFGSQKLSESTPSFGNPLTFTTSSSDKTVAKSLFGASDTAAPPSYGSSVSSPFNTTPASNLFGSGSSSTFAAKVNTTNLFGSSNSTFGSSAPTTGNSTTFGTSNTAPPSFGSSTTPLFGSQNVPTFASPNNAGTPAFGASANAFGSTISGNTATFGSTNTNAFGSNGSNVPQLANPSSSASFGSTKPSNFGSQPSANAFAFGSATASPAPAAGIFQFGPAGSVPTMPNFSPVVPGTPGDAASVVRRPKARAHRRR